MFGSLYFLTLVYNLMQIVLVMVGTYALFTTGSIAMLKGMRNNHKSYYHPKHFTAVSGMIYRMKQNAAGLASICILSTMVLVMVSMTVSMYAGVDDEFTEENVPKVPAGKACVYASREYDGKAITLLDHTYPIADTRVYGAGQDNYMASMERLFATFI